MATTSDPVKTIRRTLASLAGVRVRPMFGASAYFAGPVLFAFWVDGGMVLRLPEATRTPLLRAKRAREFLGPLPGGLNGWLMVPTDLVSVELLEQAHGMARGLARRGGRTGRTGRSSRTRRTGRKES